MNILVYYTGCPKKVQKCKMAQIKFADTFKETQRLNEFIRKVFQNSHPPLMNMRLIMYYMLNAYHTITRSESRDATCE